MPPEEALRLRPGKASSVAAACLKSHRARSLQPFVLSLSKDASGGAHATAQPCIWPEKSLDDISLNLNN